MFLDIILVKPQLAENIGMVARVMLNFGITNLHLICPKDKDFQINAIRASCDALDQINVRVSHSFEEALGDYNYLIGFSARRRNMSKQMLNLYDLFPYLQKQIFFDSLFKVGIVFGGEQSGLSNQEISYLHLLSYIPTNPAFKSLNLSHSVAIFCHEYTRFFSQGSTSAKLEPSDPLATSAEVEFFFKDLIHKLELQNFFANEARKPTSIMNIKNIYNRVVLSSNEVKILLGINKFLFGNKNKCKMDD